MTIQRYDWYIDDVREFTQGRFVLLEDVENSISKVAQEAIKSDTFDALYFERVKARLEVFQAIAKELNIPIFTASQKRDIQKEFIIYDDAPTVIIDEFFTIKKD